jgi:ornithine cyclodeaminase
LRTGAVTGLATDLLARADARVLTIFGAGATAAGQIEAVCAARPIECVNIVSRGDSARRLAARLQVAYGSRRYAAATARAAAEEADVLVTATTSSTPVFEAEWVRPGTLVCGVGSYRSDMQEIPAGLIERAAVVVDQIEAAREEAGDLLQAIDAGAWGWERLYAELGGLAAGEAAPPDAEITLFKSCGLAIEDVAAATAVLAVAEREGLGQTISL